MMKAMMMAILIGLIAGTWLFRESPATLSHEGESTREEAPAVTERVVPSRRPVEAAAVPAPMPPVQSQTEAGEEPKAPDMAAVDALLRAGRLDEAERFLERAASGASDADAALLRLGILYARMRNAPEKAIPFLRRAVERNPENEAALGELLRSVSRTGGVDESARTMRDLHASAPDSPALNAEMGRMLFSQGRPAEGIAHLEKSAAVGPVAAKLELADALVSEGRYPEAREWLTRAKAGTPDGGVVEAALSGLRQLEGG